MRSLILLLATLMAGCASTSFVPPALQSQLDRSLTFAQLKQSPESYRGRLLLLGGEVLAAKRLKEGTRLEILQLPLDNNHQPVFDRTLSEGRFLALQKDFLDPATLPPGTWVTVVGEVTGVLTQPLDETEYAFPTVDIKSLKVWWEQARYENAYARYLRQYPLWGPYYGSLYTGWGAPPMYWGGNWGNCGPYCLTFRSPRAGIPGSAVGGGRAGGRR
jgi:outer membrane lipoprotein